MLVWWPYLTYCKHELRAYHLLPYAHKRSGCTEAICSHVHIPPWISCRRTCRFNRPVPSAKATALSRNTWCQVPSQPRARYPYFPVGIPALLLETHHGASTELRKTDCFVMHASLEQRIVLACRSPTHSRPLWTKSNSPPSFPLELVRLLWIFPSFSSDRNRYHVIFERITISSEDTKTCWSSSVEEASIILSSMASNVSFVGPSSWIETDLKITPFDVPLIVFIIRLVHGTRRTTTFPD